MLPNLGFGELLVILIIALLLFGSKKLPELARGLGQSVQAFKKGLREAMSETEETKTKAISQDKKDI